MPLRLRYTPPALADLSAMLDYIAAHSPRAASRVQARIQVLTDLLLQHPHIGRRTSDPAIRRMTTVPYPYLVLPRPQGEDDRFAPRRDPAFVFYRRLRGADSRGRRAVAIAAWREAEVGPPAALYVI